MQDEKLLTEAEALKLVEDAVKKTRLERRCTGCDRPLTEPRTSCCPDGRYMTWYELTKSEAKAWRKYHEAESALNKLSESEPKALEALMNLSDYKQLNLEL